MGAARVCFALSQLGGLSTGLGCVSQPTGHLGTQVLTHSPSWVLAQQLGTAASELSITRDPQLLLWGGEASGPREPLLLPISEQNTRLASSSDRKFGAGGNLLCSKRLSESGGLCWMENQWDKLRQREG